MAEATRYTFSYKEVVEALIKQQGLHEGLWTLAVEFGLGATNIITTEGSTELSPAAIIPIKALGLQRGIEVNSITADAAVVNPRPKQTSKSKK
ncbi:MAG: hypothetical protein H0X49_15940 [Acidobacteria bacterium]|jgi:hypothetical protein|nr:hypothetical protein [Acidobacteriota bacterium]